MSSSYKYIDVTMRLVDKITKPLVSVRSHMKKTANENVRLGKTVKNIGRGITGVGYAMLPAATAVVGAVGMAGRAFIDFDSKVTMAGAKAGATAEEMKKMRDVAKTLGAELPITATEAADGMEMLASMGFTATETMKMMDPVVKASIASGKDLATVSGVVSNAMNIWNLRTGDVEANTRRVADVIQMAANRSSLSVEDFGVALGYAGAPAKAMGVQIEELSTALALMKNKGIDASMGGTALRKMFTSLGNPTGETLETLQALGVSTVDSDGKFVGLTETVNRLRTAMAHMNGTQRAAAAQALVGQQAFSGLLSLIEVAPEDYAKMQGAMEKSKGSSQKAYEEMAKTTKVQLAQVWSAWEALGISMFESIEPTLQMLMSGFKELGTWLNHLSPSAKKLIGNVGLLFVGLTGGVLVLGKLVTIGGSVILTYGKMGKALVSTTKSVRALVVNTRALNTAMVMMRRGAINGFAGLAKGIMMAARAGMAFVATPLGAAITLIAIGAYLLYRNWDSVKKLLAGAGQRAMAIFNSIKGAMQPFLDFVAQSFEATFGGVVRVIKDSINDIIGLLNGVDFTVPDWVPGVGGKHFSLNIPKLYTGVQNWTGGAAVINDAGGEIVDLPTGSRVIPHDESLAMAFQQGRQGGGVKIGDINVTVNGNVSRNTAKELAEQIMFELSVRMTNMREGAV